MKDQLIKASIQVCIDGQAYLYAQTQKVLAELYGRPMSDEEFMKAQDDWKEQSADLIKRALIFEGEDNETV
jgi:hypothetical protein